MEAKEFRLGNLFYRVTRRNPVHFVNEDLAFKVIAISEFEIDYIDYDKSAAFTLGYNKVSILDVSPILLTEKWLYAFGFMKREFQDDFYIGKINKFAERDLKLFKNKSGKFCYENHLRKIEYVHDLQNLFFAINRKELVLNQAIMTLMKKESD